MESIYTYDTCINRRPYRIPLLGKEDLKITRKQAIDYFRIMWWELARTGSPDKLSVCAIPIELLYNWECRCPLCEYADQRDISCDECLIDWPGGVCNGNNEDLFLQWEDAESISERKRIATIICNLPEKRRSE